MDVASFLALGNVLASAMTGNTALLGIALSQGDMLSAAHSVSALIGFIVGAALAAVMEFWLRQKRARDLESVRTLLLLEIFCLIAFAAMLSLIGRPGESLVVYWLILLSAVGMGIQGVAARHIRSPGINTIVFTSTLINIVIGVANRLMRRHTDRESTDDTKRQIGIFLAYALGAVLAGLLVGPLLPFVAWLPALAVVAALGCCAAAARR